MKNLNTTFKESSQHSPFSKWRRAGDEAIAHTAIKGGGIANKTLQDDVFLTNNIIGIDIDQAETYANSLTFLRAESGFSNFETSLAISGTAIDVTTAGYCGIINITGSGSLTLDTINGISAGVLVTVQSFRIQPVSGLTLTINTGSNIRLLASTGGTITLNGANNDYCDFWTDGTFAYQNSVANNF